MKQSNHLLLKIIGAIILGILLGQYINQEFLRVFITFNVLFGQFLGFCIPLIIIGLIVPSIGKLGNSASKMVLVVAFLAYISTLLAGFSSYGVSMLTFPNLLQGESLGNISETPAIEPYFSLKIPPMFDVMTALVLAFTIGIGVSKLKNSNLLKVFEEFETIITNVIAKILIPLLPLYIFGVFLGMTKAGDVFTIIEIFVKIIAIIFGLHIVYLIFLFGIAGIVSKKNPFKLLYNVLPAYFTALGTQSSAATIPVSLQQAIKNGVSEKVAKLVIPLCATIHLSGSALKIVACTIALMIVQQIPFDFWGFTGFILMLGIAMVAAPGVPGGAIMAAIGIIGSMLGFDEKNQALMISLYIAMDSFGTAGNVTGDCAIAIITDRIFKNKN
ncbi:MAG: dicarboxylate/amino acid:cation symporter [Flavobacteriaceae bacterium]|nr:dicarboxylate/amino acid:cation symporter [Flavobacteriaceae bacterium]